MSTQGHQGPRRRAGLFLRRLLGRGDVPAGASQPGRLIVIGDSHAVIWEGSDVHARADPPRFPEVTVHHLPAPLAYNLMDATGRNPGKWGQEVMARLQSEGQLTPRDCVMLSFGEIDIRTQIVKRAIMEDVTLAQATDAVVDRLIRFARILQGQLGCTVLIWEPIASASPRWPAWNPDYPALGSEQDRNACTARFAQAVRASCAAAHRAGVPLLSFGIAADMTRDGLTDIRLLRDDCHLNDAGLSLAISALRVLSARNGLDVDRHFDRVLPPSASVARSRHAVRPRAVTCAPRSTAGSDADGPWQTAPDGRDPHVTFDLGYGAFVCAAELAFDPATDPATIGSVTVSRGNDPSALSPVPAEMVLRDAAGRRLVLTCTDALPVRFLRIADSGRRQLRIIAMTCHAVGFDGGNA